MRRKAAIPWASRRAVARAHGGRPMSTTPAQCTYCGASGAIAWLTPSWVTFIGLELDHVEPESTGGSHDPSNLTLACRPCNRSKGARPLVVP